MLFRVAYLILVLVQSKSYGQGHVYFDYTGLYNEMEKNNQYH